MEYMLIYEFAPGFSKISNLFPLLIFVGFSIIFVWLIRKYRTVNQYLKKIILGFVYLFGIFALIMLITMLINIPKIISQERLVKGCIYNNECNQIEGNVEKFNINTINGNNIESFYIGDIRFEYSDNVNFYGYNKTSLNDGLIRGDGQSIRISYIEIDGVNVILKIEEIIAIKP